MRILYIAKHNSGDNDDEGAIAFALRELGHDVLCVQEKEAAVWMSNHSIPVGLILFHKWPEIGRFGLRVFGKSMYRVAPKAFWYFDLVHSDDPTLVPRAVHRTVWMNVVVPTCTVGFCTDGDWVKKDRHNRLVHLMQGADERCVGFGDMAGSPEHTPILFTGMVRHGRDRERHIAELRARYGTKLCVLGDAGPKMRMHGRKLADLFSRTSIVLAPNGPQTDNYWSNRIYLSLGFGAFLLHPKCEKLRSHYTPGVEFIEYEGNADCQDKIDYWLGQPWERRLEIAKRGYERTVREHLYRHRCEQLIRTVEERLRTS
jgi:hypothetical protein